MLDKACIICYKFFLFWMKKNLDIENCSFVLACKINFIVFGNSSFLQEAYIWNRVDNRYRSHTKRILKDKILLQRNQNANSDKTKRFKQKTLN